jgi:hypothetical protein
MTIKPINLYDNERERTITRNVIDHFRNNSHQMNDPEEIEVAKTLADLASVEISHPIEVVVKPENNEDE